MSTPINTNGLMNFRVLSPDEHASPNPGPIARIPISAILNQANPEPEPALAPEAEEACACPQTPTDQSREFARRRAAADEAHRMLSIGELLDNTSTPASTSAPTLPATTPRLGGSGALPPPVAPTSTAAPIRATEATAPVAAPPISAYAGPGQDANRMPRRPLTDGWNRIWAPNPDSNNPDEKLPVIVHGSGTGQTPDRYDRLLRDTASHGFAVFGRIDPNAGSGESLRQAVRDAERMNNDPNHPLYQRLDLENVGVMGHSQGGGGALRAAAMDNDPGRTDRFDAAVLHQPWMGPTGVSSAPGRMSDDVLVMSGAMDFIVRAAGIKNGTYDNIATGERADGEKIYANIGGAGHLEPAFTGGRYTPYTIAFFKDKLQGDPAAAAFVNQMQTDRNFVDFERAERIDGATLPQSNAPARPRPPRRGWFGGGGGFLQGFQSFGRRIMAGFRGFWSNFGW